MATIKSHTDLPQSKKLVEIFPIESADMYYSKYDTIHANTLYGSCDNQDFNIREYIPCWSLTALLNVLPDGLEDNHFLTLQKEKNEYCCCYEDINGNSFRHTFADNPIDACYELILKLHKLKML